MIFKDMLEGFFTEEQPKLVPLVPFDDGVVILDAEGVSLSGEEQEELDGEMYEAYEAMDEALANETPEPTPDCDRDFNKAMESIIRQRKGK